MLRLLSKLALALGLLAPLCSAQTNVGGPIFSNTTWTAAGSPYQLTSSIIVGAGATLTIQPGVEVRFSTNGRILIVGDASLGAGALVARGTVAQPIRFTSTAGNPGSWDAILFADRAIDAQLDMNGDYLSGSILEHCIVEFGGGSSSYEGAVEVLNSSPLLVNTVARNNSRRGIRASMAAGSTGPTPPLNMRSCEMRQNGRGGFQLTSGSAHRITGCQFVQNFGPSGVGGVGALFSSASDLRIDMCSFVDNNGTNSGGVGLQLTSCGNAQMSACQVSGNVGSTGAGMSANSCFGAQVLDCVFEFNVSSSQGGGAYFQSCSGLIATDSQFRSNSGSSGGGGYFLFGSTSLIGCTFSSNVATTSGGGASNVQSSLVASNCIIEQNEAQDGAGIHLGSGGSISFSDCLIANNEASDDGGGIFSDSAFTLTTSTVSCNIADDGGGLYLQGNSANVTMAGNPTTGTFNTFQGNTANRGDQIFNDRTFSVSGANNVDAGYVCWGTSDPNANPNALWDFFDNSTLGIVIASNFASCAPIGCGCVGVNYCVLSPNSAGAGAVMGYLGSTSLAANDFTLTVADCPPNKAGLFFFGALQSNLPFGAGVRCIDGPLQRLSLLTTDASGNASLDVDLTAPPAAGTITPGSVWNFQFWFRDPGFGGANFNLSDGLEVTFCD